MGERQTDNFIKAFVEKYQDGFVPNKFYLWSAISVVAAVLERRVWLPWGTLNFYPNMFVFLVSKPGVGKSSAIRPAIKLIRKLKADYGKELNVLPNKVTEPKLLDLLGHHHHFQYPPGTWNRHTSYYYYASEASTCFEDPYGGFVQTLTALYDGDDITKATVSRGKTVEVNNPCLNLIAGATFDYLGRLLNREGIMGGFASRITYVIYDEKNIRKAEWRDDERGVVTSDDSKKILHDLAEIYDMAGPFRATEEYKELYKEWFHKNEVKRNEIDNEKLQSLLIRKDTMLKKLPMILSAAESSSRLLEARHWHWAEKLMEEVEEGIPGMIRASQAADIKSSQGIINAILQELSRGPLHSQRTLVGELTTRGFDSRKVNETLYSLVNSGDLIRVVEGALVLVKNPNLYI